MEDLTVYAVWEYGEDYSDIVGMRTTYEKAVLCIRKHGGNIVKNNGQPYYAIQEYKVI